MIFRLLVASDNPEFRATLRALTVAAVAVLPIALDVDEASTIAQVRERLLTWHPDALMVDWSPSQAGMLETLRGLLAEHPDLRTLVLLPDGRREYREAVWETGACACIPRDRADPEWLQAVVCVMTRAREREARFRAPAAR